MTLARSVWSIYSDGRTEGIPSIVAEGALTMDAASGLGLQVSGLANCWSGAWSQRS